MPCRIPRVLLPALLLLALTIRDSAAETLERVKALVPSDADLLLVLDLEEAVRDYLISMYPIAPERARELIVEESAAFEKETGYNPLEQVESVVLAGRFFDPTQKSWILVFFVSKSPVLPIREKLISDHARQVGVRETRIQGFDAFDLSGFVYGFPAENVIVAGRTAYVEKVTGDGDSPLFDHLLEPELAAGKLRLAMIPSSESIQKFTRSPQAQRFGGALYNHLTWVGGAIGYDTSHIVMSFGAEGAAQAGRTQISGILETARAQMVQQATSLEATTLGPIERLSMQRLTWRVVSDSLLHALDTATVAGEGRQMSLNMKNDRVAILEGPGAMVILGALAVGLNQMAQGPALNPGIPGMR